MKAIWNNVVVAESDDTISVSPEIAKELTFALNRANIERINSSHTERRLRFWLIYSGLLGGLLFLINGKLANHAKTK